MHVRLMVTADQAEVQPDTQRMNIFGVASRISAARFPARIPRLCLALIIEGNASQAEDLHAMRIRLLDAAGQVMFQLAGSFVMDTAAIGQPPLKSMVCELNGVVFPSPGDYRIDLDVNDGELKAATTVHVAKSEA